MRYKTHLLGGITTGLLTHELFSQQLSSSYSLSTDLLLSAFVLSSAIGSLFPDIDEPESFLGRKVKPLSVLIKTLNRHRGFTHAPIIHFIFYVLLFNLVYNYIDSLPLMGFFMVCLTGFLLGVYNHILLDALTPMGVPLFYPISSKYFHLARIRTGSFGEKIFAFFLFIFLIYLIFKGFFLHKI